MSTQEQKPLIPTLQASEQTFFVYRCNNGWVLEIPKKKMDIGDSNEMLKFGEKWMSNFGVGKDKQLMDIEEANKIEPISGIFLFDTWDKLSGFMIMYFPDEKAKQI